MLSVIQNLTFQVCMPTLFYVCESWTVIHRTYLGFNCGAPQKFLVSLVTYKIVPLTKWRIIFRLVEANLFCRTHTQMACTES